MVKPASLRSPGMLRLREEALTIIKGDFAAFAKHPQRGLMCIEKNATYGVPPQRGHIRKSMASKLKR